MDLLCISIFSSAVCVFAQGCARFPAVRSGAGCEGAAPSASWGALCLRSPWEGWGLVPWTWGIWRATRYIHIYTIYTYIHDIYIYIIFYMYIYIYIIYFIYIIYIIQYIYIYILAYTINILILFLIQIYVNYFSYFIYILFSYIFHGMCIYIYIHVCVCVSSSGMFSIWLIVLFYDVLVFLEENWEK